MCQLETINPKVSQNNFHLFPFYLMGVFGNSKTRLNCENVSRTMAGAGGGGFSNEKTSMGGVYKVILY